MYQATFASSKWLTAVAVGLTVVLGAAAAHAQDPLKCRRAIAKNAAGFEGKKIKALQKCRDGVLKDGAGVCPDAKATGKISGALSKATDKITGACAGVSLTDMNFAGLASQCTAGYTPGLPCQAPADCVGTCQQGRYEGEPCTTASFCQGFCGQPVAPACSSDSQCNVPAGEQCSEGTCAAPRIPFQTCNSDAGCTTAPFTTCYEEGGTCDNAGACDPVDFCPSVQNDSKVEPFGLTAVDDCYFPLTDEASVAACVTCVGEQVVDQLISTYFDTANPPSTDKDALKCQRTLGKAAAGHYAKVRKALQKCQDGVLKNGSGSCPDAKATDKIGKSQAKLADKISKDCGDDPTRVAAFVLSQIVGRSGRPDSACATLGSDATSVAAALECLTSAAAECNDALGVGSSPLSCNPSCGNAKLDAGETCDDSNQLQESGIGPADFCPADCTIAACTPSGSQQGATVSFAAPADLTGLTVVLYYDESKVQIPGQNSDAAVQTAVGSLTFAMTPVDTDYALRNVLLDPSLIGVPSGEAFTVTFDTCQGAPAPVAADFHCFVADATDATFAPVAGATCSVTVP